MHLRMATCEDIGLLVSMRLSFVEADEKDTDYMLLKENCYSYFKRAFSDHACDVVLAEENGRCVGTGIVFYYDSVPSTFNVTGKNAYITSLYVEPEYRCNGIGTEIIAKIVEKVLERKYKIIMLNASEMGKPLYEKLGFIETKNSMILDMRNGFC